MRLLHYDERGELRIASFDDCATPPYAILSHTWGVDADEVTFADLATGDGMAKRGYKKIHCCGQQAQQDRLQYFWVDTCCIDKTDKAELSHAIRSMFRWYQNSARCYVYLSDVPIGSGEWDHMLSEFNWEPAFRASRWFTRGWTLQELLAPSTVEFFSQEWEKLGSKTSLKLSIHRITSISLEALDGALLSQFSADERLRWKQGRETKHEEDGAYSLQGIFSVDIAPLYGEGAAGAFRRLMDEFAKLQRCIRDLRPTDPRDDKKRIEDTAGGLIADSYRWVLDNATFQQWRQDAQSQLLWVKGDPGKGKTMLLCGIINELQSSLPKTTLLAYFFCQATDSRINNATAVLRGLLYMLVTQQSSLALHVCNKYNHAGRALFEDANAWVALTEIFTDLLQDPQLRSTYLIIDALDECVTDLPKLLRFVAEQSSVSSRVKWIVSSRNWPEIEQQLEQAGHNAKLSLELNAESVSAAVDVFVEHKVAQLAQRSNYNQQMQDMVLESLTAKADDTFLWVSLVCQELQATRRWNVRKKLEHFPSGLDALYERMMHQISVSDDAELCKQVLALAALVYRPITLEELVVLAEPLEDIAGEAEVREIIGLCGSFLTLREDTVYLVHRSAQEFLCVQAADHVFPDGIKAAHRAIFSRSLIVLSRTLHRDMYDLVAPGAPIDRVEIPIDDPLKTMRYSCIYWIEHLFASASDTLICFSIGSQDGGAVDDFLRKNFLYWLETLSLCESISTGLNSMTKLETLMQVCLPQANYSRGLCTNEPQGKAGLSALCELVQDGCQFILSNRGVVEKYPLQTYCSALIFTPRNSPVRRQYENEQPRWLRRFSHIHDEWSPCKQTLEQHRAAVNAMTFLSDSLRLASASDDRTIRLWDIKTGECEKTFEGHESAIHGVASSPDGERLASAGNDKTIRLWEVATGQCLKVLVGHRSSVKAVAFAPNGQWLASGSNDKTIRLWTALTYEFERVLQDHRSGVNDVLFSPDSSLIASASNDKTVKLWSTANFDCLFTLQGHSSEVYSLAISSDGQQLASASNDESIWVWDINGRECQHVLRGHDSYVTSVAFSPDALHLVSGSDDKTLRLWDVEGGMCENIFEGHQDSITSVAFLPNSQQLASASKDNMLRVWTATAGTYQRSTTGHRGLVNVVSFSPDGNWFATASVDRNVCLWDTATVDCIHVLEGHRSDIYAVVFSNDCNWLASASRDKTIRIWNVHSGLIEQILEGHESDIYAVAFSPNSQWIVSGSNDETVRLWDVEFGDCIGVFEGHRASVHSVVFSEDGQRIASASKDQTIRLWDTKTGHCMQVASAQETFLGIVPSPDALPIQETLRLLHLTSAELAFVPGRSPENDLVFPPQTVAQSDAQMALQIHVEDDWVLRDGKRFLWLPPDRRPSCSAVYENMVVIGHSSGSLLQRPQAGDQDAA